MPTTGPTPALAEAIGAIPASGRRAGGRTVRLFGAVHAIAAHVYVGISPARPGCARDSRTRRDKMRGPRRTQRNDAERKNLPSPHDNLPRAVPCDQESAARIACQLPGSHQDRVSFVIRDLRGSAQM